MKLHLLSDLHMEFKGSAHVEELVQPADVLILAGDIDVGATKVAKRLKAFSQHYAHVLYTPGNHEFYDGSSPERFDLGLLPDNVHVLAPGTVTIGGVKFIGATLWTDFNKKDPECLSLSRMYISDFRRANVTVEQYIKLHQRDRAFIESEATPEAVVFTHFMPYRQCVHPKWTLDPTTRALNGYFCNDLAWIPAGSWLFGHTHDKYVGERNGTKLYSNPKGYVGENAYYEPMIIEVGGTSK